MKGPRAGAVRLSPTSFVAPGAVVLGEVTIGPRASVWFNTVVRGDVDTIEIGELSNVQDNSTVHVDDGSPCRIGARVTIGHRSIVHGCVIENDCLIGMGSVLLSGCHIGTGSYIGASSLVLEGMEIPPGSVALGSPARVVGQVGERHRDGIRHGSETYAELASACMRRGMARHVSRDGEIVTERAPMTGAERGIYFEALRRVEKHLQGRFRMDQTDERFWRAVERLRELDAARRSCLERLARKQEAVWNPPPPGPPDLDQRTMIGLRKWELLRMWILGHLTLLDVLHCRSIVAHPTRGPFSYPELLREWSEEDQEILDSLHTPLESET